MENIRLFKTNAQQNEYINGGGVKYPTVQYNKESNGIKICATEPITFWFDDYTETCVYTLKKAITWEELINNFYYYFETDISCSNFNNEYAPEEVHNKLIADNTREEVYYRWCDGIWMHFSGCNCGGTTRLGILTDSEGNVVKKTDLVKSGNYIHNNLDEEIDNPQECSGIWE